MNKKRMLISLAHPDDESFGGGGIIGKYVSEGADVSYICATKGNRGTVSQRFLDQYGSIEAVRDAELNCASEVLGFSEVIKFGYDDSGMMGTPDNENPDCLWQADESEVTGRVVEVIRRLKPQVILTFDPFCGYGHPDHIFIHRATTRAFHAAGDAAQYPEMGEAYQPQKLYFMSFPRRILQFYILMMRLRGVNPRHAGRNKDMNFIEVLERAQKPNVFINVSKWLSVWDEASRCHASQASATSQLPDWLRRILVSRQGVFRQFPEMTSREKRERDLFAGISEP